MSESFKAVQEENYQLRDYIINLQSRLIESQGDFPPPPSNVDLPEPSRRQNAARQELPRAPPQPAHIDYNAINQLRASAAQAGQDLGIGVPSKHPNEDAYGSTAESHERKRLKGDDGGADASTAAQEALQGGSMANESRISNSQQTRDLTIGSVLNRSARDGNSGRPLLSA